MFLLVLFVLLVALKNWLVSSFLPTGQSAGGEAQSKHKEGFDPLKCSLCVRRNWLWYGAGPSLRTVA